MTVCCICSQPTPGTDDEDAPCCGPCWEFNWSQAEMQPLVRRDTRGRLRLVEVWRWGREIDDASR